MESRFAKNKLVRHVKSWTMKLTFTDKSPAGNIG